MGYNKGDIITVQIFNITEIGAFVRLEGRTSGMIHFSEVPCKYGQVADYLQEGQQIKVMVLGEGKPDKYGNTHYNLSKKKADEQAIKEQVAKDVKNLGGEEKTIREIWKVFTQINKLLLQYMKQPIVLIPDSAKLYKKDKKLVVQANTESKFNLFKKSFAQKFNTALIPITKNSWSFYANVDQISPRIMKEFEEECECLYMNFFPQPFLEGKIWGFKKDKEEEIKKQLEECFPNIVISTPRRGEIDFRQSYSSHSQARDFHAALYDIILEIKTGCTIENEETGELTEYPPIDLEYRIKAL